MNTQLQCGDGEMRQLCADPGVSASIAGFVAALHQLQRDHQTQKAATVPLASAQGDLPLARSMAA